MECAGLREEAAAAVQGHISVKSEYETYNKRVQSVLAEQDPNTIEPLSLNDVCKCPQPLLMQNPDNFSD